MAKHVSDIRKTVFRRGIVALFATVALMCAPGLALADDSRPLDGNPDQLLSAIALEGDSPISAEADADESDAQTNPATDGEIASDADETQADGSSSDPSTAQNDNRKSDAEAEATVEDHPTGHGENLPAASEPADNADNTQTEEDESFVEGLREGDVISGFSDEDVHGISGWLIAGKGEDELGYESEIPAFPGLENAAISELENIAARDDTANDSASAADANPTEPELPVADTVAPDDDAAEKAVDPDEATPSGKAESKSKHSAKQPSPTRRKTAAAEAAPAPTQLTTQSAPALTCTDSTNCNSENESDPVDAPAEPSQPPATPAPAPAEPSAPAGPTSSITNLLRTIGGAHHNSAAALAAGSISLGGPRMGSAASQDENGKTQPPCQGRIRCRSPSIA